MRLNVFLSRCGAASRRGADALIAAGRVTVNGRAAVLGEDVTPGRDEVFLDGKPVEGGRAASGTRTTILLHKPEGYLVSRRDPHHSRTVYDLLPAELYHLVPVGRLDLRTEGVLLMSDDGPLVERLTHPRNGVPRVYRALVCGVVGKDSLAALRVGVEIDGVRTAPARARVASVDRQREGTTELEIILREGRKRQIRLMCRAVGHPVLRLCRTMFGGLGLGDLRAGQWRHVDGSEVRALLSRAESVRGSRH